MRSEISPRTRSFLSGLAAIALTTVIATTLVESVKPVLILSSGSSTPVSVAALDSRGEATFA